MARVSSISELNDSTDRWRILVCVDRKWNVYHKTSPNELFCVTMVFVDKEGNKIQASVLLKSLLDQYRQTPVEGETYFIANFVLSSNTNTFRATTHPFKINFTQTTYILGQATNIPVHCYSFLPLADIIKVDEGSSIPHLFDVYGFVKSMGQLEEYRRDHETKHKLRMVITDNDDNDVECIFFDECSTNTFMGQLQITDNLLVVIINYCRVGFSEEGLPQICSSFNATRVLYNPPIKEVKDLMHRARDQSSPILTVGTQPLTPASTQSSGSSMMRNTQKIDIAQIQDQEVDKRTYDFPDELDNLIGKKMILKLKINAYNKKYSNSSISVTQYTECGDLMNEFTEANDEGQVEDNSKEVSNQHMDKPRHDEPVENHQPSVQQVSQNYAGLEEITITELVKTQVEPTAAQTKGKRKCAAKKQPVVDDSVKTCDNVHSLGPHTKSVKIIKQEKNL